MRISSSHISPRLFERKDKKKKPVKLLRRPSFPMTPTSIKNNNTVAVGNRGEAAWAHVAGPRQTRHGGERWPLVRLVVVGGGGGSHCAVVTSVCDWRTSKGLARERVGRGGGGMDGGEGRDGGEGEQGGNEKKEEDGPFF